LASTTSTVSTSDDYINTFFNKTLTLLDNLIINSTSKLLINNNISSHSTIPHTSSSYTNTSSHQSIPYINPIINNLTENPIALYSNQQANNKGVIIDSGCTDSSYRASDAASTTNDISTVPSHAQLDLTTANGGHVYSTGIATREFPFNKSDDGT
jgi:hypothetical protein